MKRKEYKYVLEHLIYLLLGKADFVEIHLEIEKGNFENWEFGIVENPKTF